MKSVEEALSAILEQVTRLESERVPLLEALGRVLDEDILADIPVPPFANSAVDGYAARAAETVGASSARPVRLRLVADLPAGAWPETALAPGTAARILTGAPVPPGADAVVMQEDTRRRPDGFVEVLAAVEPGQHIREAGEDIPRGARALTAGTPIRAAEIAVLATMGRPTVQTVRPARVAIVTTGDEVVDIESGIAPPPGKIRNSNRYALAAQVRETGATLCALQHIQDDLEATEQTLRELSDPAQGADVIIAAGGVSVGDRDYVKPALEKLGRLELWKVAIKPGKPLAFGRLGPALFFGLPGNPVSAMVTFELFARPALRKLAGYADADLCRAPIRAVVGEAVAHTPGRREYVRAITRWEGDGYMARPTGAQGSGILHSLTRANSLLIVPEDSPGLSVGEIVEALLLD
jgi:molybdopterin molybdotransferase